MFDELCNDTIFVVKADGSRTGPHRCSFSGTQAQVFDEHLDAPPGERVERELPGGRTEGYKILDAAFSKGLMGIPSYWMLDLEREGSVKPQTGQAGSTINIHGSHGIQIGDNNRQDIVHSVQALVSAIENGDGTTEEKAEAKGRLRAFLEHPLVGAILGGATAGLLGSL